SDAIGAFLIGLVLGATRFRGRIEQLALPLRDVFGAFFFLNFGLALDPSTFGAVWVQVIVAVVLTLVVNTLGGQLIAWINKLTPAEGFNASAMLQNRGEFALILATLAVSAGLDARLTPFEGLYVLIMSIIAPVLAANSERAGAVLFRKKRRAAPAAKRSDQRDAISEENFALLEAATSDQPVDPPTVGADRADVEEDAELLGAATAEHEVDDDYPVDDVLRQQAMSQSDENTQRTRDPEY
ncbi:MAG: potassium transporter, partial [Microbacteriaceae bacterium]|nr:potassium transporter [Microbacteriaceae bacterium]